MVTNDLSSGSKLRKVFHKKFMKTFLNVRAEKRSFVTVGCYIFESFHGWNLFFYDVHIFVGLRSCFWKSSHFKFVKTTQITHNSFLRCRRGLLKSFLKLQFLDLFAVEIQFFIMFWFSVFYVCVYGNRLELVKFKVCKKYMNLL